MRLCDALSIKRVVICKSALPWAGGVKLGKKERDGQEYKRKETDRQNVNDRDECEREGAKSVSGLYYITSFF